MGKLQRSLEEYANSDYYPYHMPGHKRRLFGKTLAPIAAWDITEIDGFDNLHDARGILKEVQSRAADVYGAEESFFLINGSTSGILSALSAALQKGGKLLMVRGCHKSAYHAAYLRSLEIKYLFTGIHPEFGCILAATAAQVKQALAENQDVQAVLIVSPTYEGLMAETAEIAEVVHKRGIPLIVDEAHGAHLGFHAGWQQNASRQGADLVVQSLHKTLPSMTQTAILHVNGSLIERRKLRRFLEIYQTSSPSYIFMAAMEEAIEIASGAEPFFSAFQQNWKEMMEKLGVCKALHFLKEKSMDAGKLVIADRTGSLSGRQLYDKLRNQYHLQLEMAAGRYVLAMFTIGDTKEGYERLTKALLEIDRECSLGEDGQYAERQNGGEQQNYGEQQNCGEQQNSRGQQNCGEQQNSRGQQNCGEQQNSRGQQNRRKPAEWVCPEQRYPLCEAWDRETERVLLAEAAGRTAGSFIVPYPPDIPIAVPGEVLTKEICRYLQECVREGLTVQGIEEHNHQLYIETIK